MVFGAEPSEEEILKFILERWDTLRFSPEVEAERRREPGNPKRRQREAAKAAAKAAPSTKAQQAIAEMREQGKGGGPEEERRREEGDRIGASAPCAQRSARRNTAGIDRISGMHYAQDRRKPWTRSYGG